MENIINSLRSFGFGLWHCVDIIPYTSSGIIEIYALWMDQEEPVDKSKHWGDLEEEEEEEEDEEEEEEQIEEEELEDGIQSVDSHSRYFMFQLVSFQCLEFFNNPISLVSSDEL